MTKLKKVCAVRDNDSHWYVIPFELKDEFFKELENGENDEYDSFIEKFDSYITGGDLNLVQLYAENINDMAQKDEPVLTQQSVVTKESDTKTVMGLNALTLPTPDKIKAIFKMITFFIGIIALGATSFREIPEDVQKQILEYTVFTGLVLQKAEDFFGIKITG